MSHRAVYTGMILVSLFAADAAMAQNSRLQNARVCAELEGELARLQRGGSSVSSRNYEKFDAAYHNQLAELDAANTRAKRDSCFGGGGFLFKRTPKASCPALLDRIDKMERNLAAIERQRSKYSPAPRNDGQVKANLVRQLAQNRCGSQYERFAAESPRPQRQGLFSRLFKPRSETIREYNPALSDLPKVGTYRTVCVRSCDGFFFPVSFSTTESNFGRDQAVCASSCPGTDAELYVYRNPGETVEDMYSVNGQPYKALSTAFLYQKEYVPNCSCQAPQSKLASLTNSDSDAMYDQSGASQNSQQQMTSPAEQAPHGAPATAQADGSG